MVTDDQPAGNPLEQRRRWAAFSKEVDIEGRGKFYWKVDDFRVKDIVPSDRFKQLNEQEQAVLFNSIVMEVLKRSEHPDGSRSAAVAITKSGQIFVSNNTQRQHEFHKDCAEINMINVLTQLVGTEDKIAKMYLTIGFKEGDIITPCGKCMDTLCDACMDNASITVLPINDNGDLPIKLNTKANYPTELKSGDSWQTTVQHFMPYRTLDLSATAQRFAEDGLEALTSSSLPSVRILDRKAIVRLLTSDKSTFSLGDQYAYERLERILSNLEQGHTGADLELAADSSLKNINRRMVALISQAYHARPDSGPERPGEHEVKFIRCVVVRLADGSFYSTAEIEGSRENAVPHPEVTAVAMTRLEAQPITDVWVMEMNPDHIKEGKLYTSPKEGLERIYKRRPLPEHQAIDYKGNPVKNENVNVHYIPFNDGRRTHDEVSEITTSFRMDQIFISQWKGSRQYQREGNGEVADSPARGLG